MQSRCNQLIEKERTEKKQLQEEFNTFKNQQLEDVKKIEILIDKKKQVEILKMKNNYESKLGQMRDLYEKVIS